MHSVIEGSPRSSTPHTDGCAIWNGAVDRRPRAIVEWTSAQDVVAALGWARAQRLRIAVRGGGHSIPGLSICDGGVVIDLGPMRQVAVDPITRTAVAGPGARGADYDAATTAHGLGSPGGGPIVLVAIGMHPASMGRDTIRTAAALAADLPRDVGLNISLINAPPIPEVVAGCRRG